MQMAKLSHYIFYDGSDCSVKYNQTFLAESLSHIEQLKKVLKIEALLEKSPSTEGENLKVCLFV